MGLSAAPLGRRSCIVIVEVGDGEGASQIVGVLVDAVYEVFEAVELEATPAFGTPIDPEFIAGMARVDGGVLSVLAFDRVLAQDELARLVSAHTSH